MASCFVGGFVVLGVCLLLCLLIVLLCWVCVFDCLLAWRPCVEWLLGAFVVPCGCGLDVCYDCVLRLWFVWWVAGLVC